MVELNIRLEAIACPDFILYACPVLAKVYLGYVDGVACPSPECGPAVYGQIVSEIARGRQVLELWPFDFPLSAKQTSTVKPLRALWKPQVSGFMVTQFGLSGLERVAVGRRHRWVAQRWLCEPMSYEAIRREQRENNERKPKALAPFVR